MCTNTQLTQFKILENWNKIFGTRQIFPCRNAQYMTCTWQKIADRRQHGLQCSLRRTLQNITVACLVKCQSHNRLCPDYIRNLRHYFHVTWCTPYLSSMRDFSVMESCARHILQRMSSNRDSAVAWCSLSCVSGTICCVYKYGTLWNILLRTAKVIPRITKRLLAEQWRGKGGGGRFYVGWKLR